MSPAEIPPVERSISVSWSPDIAFRRFTQKFGSWWPSRTYSLGGERIKQLVFEQHEGGRIYEEHMDGWTAFSVGAGDALGTRIFESSEPAS